jgi:ABC-type transport system substrate-binding protein
MLQGCGPLQDDLFPDSSAGIVRELRMPASRIRGFDPARAADVSTARAVARIYEGLLQYDYRARPYRLQPLLAAEMPAVSGDGLTYTFKIRPGLYFQDDSCFTETGGRGRELVAEDFVYSLKRIADIKNGSTGYWAFRDRIPGLDAFRDASAMDAPTDYSMPVKGLQATDRYTLQIQLKRPYPQLLWVLTMPYAFVVAREAVDEYGEAFINHPVGTGPYVLEQWRRNYRVVFARNPVWARTGRDKEELVRLGAGGSPPSVVNAGSGNGCFPWVERITGYVIGDPSTRWLSFMQGHLDLYSEISRENWEAVITAGRQLSDELYARGIRLESIPELNTYYIGFNMDDPVVGANRKLRQAMSYAFNTAEWLTYYNDRVVRACGPIPPGVAGSREGPIPYAFNLEKAAQLLAEAGYPAGQDPATGRRLELTLELGKTDTEMRESTELLMAFMARIGVVVRPSYNNKPTLFKKIEKRQAQMFRLSWYADYPDAENFLQLFYGPNSSPGPNRVNYSNPAFDRLYERVRTMQDSPERTALYARMADMVIDDAPWIFMHHTVNYTLRHDWLRGYHPHDFPYGMEKYYWIERR